MSSVKISNTSDNKSICSSGIKSISEHKDRRFHTITYRIDFLKELLKNNTLEPIVDLDNLDTESFINPNGYKTNNDTDDSDSTDIRKIINKKKLDFFIFK